MEEQQQKFNRDQLVPHIMMVQRNTNFMEQKSGLITTWEAEDKSYCWRKMFYTFTCIINKNITNHCCFC